ncbi:MAG: transglutaminase-like domain-containing protein [Phycisphaerae bacterium]|nr:transglutaminase-like domain-containing protein [Phycisphaerae bacterium]
MTRVFLWVVIGLLAVCQVAAADLEYLAVFMNNKKIGYAVEERVVTGSEVRSTETMFMTISRMGVPLSIEASETAIETVDGKPLGFEMTQKMSVMSTEASGRINDQGVLEVVTTTMGNKQTQTLPWVEGAIMTEGMRLLSEKYGLKQGTRFQAKVFTAGMMQAVDMQIEVGARQSVDLLGRVVRLTEVKSSYALPGAGQMMAVSYVDDNLDTQKSVIPIMGMNIEMVACSREFALAPVEDVSEMFRDMMLASPTRLSDLDQVKSVQYHLKPKSSDMDLSIPSTDNQTVIKNDDGSLTLTVTPIRVSQGGTFPYTGADATLKKALEANPVLQCDDPNVMALARKAVAEAPDAARAAANIETFVGQYIDQKDLSVGYASAVEVMESRQGDCTEHAVLTAALCRAVGIPAEVVIGVAYVDEFMGTIQSFGGHAWTRAWVNGHWIGLDAAFVGIGRGGYDAGHIALATGNGESSDFFSLIGSIGKFNITEAKVME